MSILGTRSKLRGFRSIRCAHCKLPGRQCLCSDFPNIESRASFAVLIHSQELQKPTSTGSLVVQCLRDSKLVVWDRVREKELSRRFFSKAVAPCVVFPKTSHQKGADIGKEDLAQIENPGFIYIDGTWRQARRIYRQSRYLQSLPIISLSEIKRSHHRLRTSKLTDQLLTIEAVIATLDLIEEPDNASKLRGFFDQYSQTYIRFK